MNQEIETRLAKYGVYYREIRFSELATPIQSVADLSRALDLETTRITAMVAIYSSRPPLRYLAITPADRKLNLHVIEAWSQIARFDSVTSYLPVIDIHARDGHPSLFRGDAQVLLDETLIHYPTIVIEEGTPEIVLEIAPVGLCMALDATVLQLADR
jgi:prolyl-tRNA editing enzyme YbaK/EbsC (Cys-tRNA(Pro) deacylase)